MIKENIIIAFSSDAIIANIEKILYASGFNSLFLCSSGAEVKKIAMTLKTGIIICGYKLKDMSIISLIETIPEEFSIILIGNYSQLSFCESGRVFKLFPPIRREELLKSIFMLVNMHHNYNQISALPTEDEKRKKIIEDAKVVLITKYFMSEEQAHKYIQKKSMDTGAKMVDIARLILD